MKEREPNQIVVDDSVFEEFRKHDAAFDEIAKNRTKVEK